MLGGQRLDMLGHAPLAGSRCHQLSFHAKGCEAHLHDSDAQPGLFKGKCYVALIAGEGVRWVGGGGRGRIGRIGMIGGG
jgi:hypothetical protein